MHTASCNGAPHWRMLGSSDDCVRGLQHLRAHEHGELSHPWSGTNIRDCRKECCVSFILCLHARLELLSVFCVVFSPSCFSSDDRAWVAWRKTLDPQVNWKSVSSPCTLDCCWCAGHKAAYGYACEYARCASARAPVSVAERKFYSQFFFFLFFFHFFFSLFLFFFFLFLRGRVTERDFFMSR